MSKSLSVHSISQKNIYLLNSSAYSMYLYVNIYPFDFGIYDSVFYRLVMYNEFTEVRNFVELTGRRQHGLPPRKH
jgi:hypothetical protein